jgi:hypothetical protein
MIDEPQITPEQDKAARLVLGWGAKHVCRTLGITPLTLDRAELGRGKDGPASPAVFTRLRRLYEAAGVEFPDGGQPRVKGER